MQIHALLIGIDSYPTAPLEGCVNDSELIEDYLRTTVKQLNLQTLRNEQATKANIVEAFLRLAKVATANDIVFVHYSGHGSREQADPMFWHLEPDRQNEVMVTVDAINPFTNEFNPLSDKELRWLINQVAQKNPQISIMFDCCHSGGGTRDNSRIVTPRYTQAKGAKVRDANQYVFAQQKYGGNITQLLGKDGRFSLPSGRHILMAGARSNQTAKELIVGDQKHGIFTYSILEVLKNSGGNVSYNNLMKRAEVRVIGTVFDQRPQLEPIVPADADLLFLQGAAALTKRSYVVTKNMQNGLWVLDAGAVQGIPFTVAPTTFALYDNQTDPETQPQAVVMEAFSTRVLPTTTELQLAATPAADSYKARLVRTEVKPTMVHFRTETAGSRIQQRGVELARAALAKAAGTAAVPKPSSYLREVDTPEQAEYVVIAYEIKGVEKYRIVRPTADIPLVRQLEVFSAENAQKLIGQLEHLSRYDRTMQLNNNAGQLGNALGISVLVNKNGQEQTVASSEGVVYLPYQGGEPGSFRLKITNNSSGTLFCSMLYLAADFSVTNEYLALQELAAGEEIFINDGEPIPLEVDDSRPQMGINEERAILKFIAATEQFDSSLLNQTALELPVSMRNANDATTDFDRLLGSVGTMRGLKFGNKPKPTSDWTTNMVTFIGTKTLPEQEVRNNVLSRINIKQPTGLLAKIGLSSLFGGNRTRSIDTPLAPLPDAFANSRPVHFGNPTGDAADLNVLELSDIQNPQAVSERTPLTIELPMSLAANERIIPFATDGELYYPLGFSQSQANSTTVTIQRLPTASTSERSLGTTVKIVLQKLAGEQLGFPYPYPALCVVTRAADGKLQYRNGRSDLQTALAQGGKTLLVVHGFSSTTQAMLAPDANSSKDDFYSWLAGQYSTILAFDYDTFSTTIAESAQHLAKKITELGVSSRSIDVLAHCSGGLVARTWIEQLGGNAAVHKLVMAGTPNNGTPWTRLRDWAVVAATFAANNLTRYGMSPETVAFLSDKAQLSAQLDRVSNDLRAGSAFLTQLNRSTDPLVPYTIVAGNTALIQHPNEQTKNWVQRIFNRTNIATLAHRTLNLFLFGDKNDIGVSVRSMQAVPANRQQRTICHEAACDHFTYFTALAGVSRVKQSLQD